MSRLKDPPVTTDEQLVGITLQSQEAFGALVERYYRMVFAIALSRVRSTEIAEEIAQETFLRAYLHLGDLRRPEQLSSWLGSIARNLAENWRLSGQTRSQLAAMVPMDAEASAVPDNRGPDQRADLAARQEHRLVREALERLPACQREVVTLHFLEGLSKSDIAERIGVYPSSVGRQLDKALRQLRTELGALLRPDSVAAVSDPSRAAVSRTLALLVLVAAWPKASQAALIEASGTGDGPAGTDASSLVSDPLFSSITSGGSTMLGIKIGIALALTAGLAGGVYKTSSKGPTPVGSGVQYAGQVARTSGSPSNGTSSGTLAKSFANQTQDAPISYPYPAYPAYPSPPTSTSADSQPVTQTATQKTIAQATPAVTLPKVRPLSQAAQSVAGATSASAIGGHSASGDAVEAALLEKYNRAKNDMRTMATALETYYVDNNAYPASDTSQKVRKSAPGEGSFPSFQSRSLTTPIAYVMGYLKDPFSANDQTFGYVQDTTGWMLLSPGPDGKFDINSSTYSSTISQPTADLIRNMYDPSNGILSTGDILRVKQ